MANIDFDDAVDAGTPVESFTLLSRKSVEKLEDLVDVVDEYGADMELYTDYGEDLDGAYARTTVALEKIEELSATLRKQARGKYEAMSNV